MELENTHEEGGFVDHRNHQWIDHPVPPPVPAAQYVSGPPPNYGSINTNRGPIWPQGFPGFINADPIGYVAYGFNPATLMTVEMERSMSLFQFMVDEGLVPSPDEEKKRRNAIDELKQIVMQWIKSLASQRRLPRTFLKAASATILTYGSYGLGVHNSESDIDAICICPCFARMADDFFIGLRDMLSSRSEVSEIHCIKEAKVPLMRFKFNGISIDLPYAQIKLMYVPENIDIFNPFFLRHIDENSWRNLSGVRANKNILRLVPNLHAFQSLLRAVKFWAKRRGVYGNLLGFLGGVHLAVLVAFVCQRYPTTSISALVTIFFTTFAFWPWPSPVILQSGMAPAIVPFEARSLMPIQLPSSLFEFCRSNITTSTFHRITTEFVRGHRLAMEILRPRFDWGNLFEPFAYARIYNLFVKIILSASTQDELGNYLGWIKSRFRGLILKLELLLGFCDPNPTEYVDADLSEPNVVFYWGIQHVGRSFLDIDLVREDFIRSISKGAQSPKVKVDISIVKAAQLPKNARFNGRSKGTRTCWRMVDSSKQRSSGNPNRQIPDHLGHCLATNETQNS